MIPDSTRRTAAHGRAYPLGVWALSLALAASACQAPPSEEVPAAGPDLTEAKSFQPLPAVMASPDNPRTPEKVALGRMLYFDTRFSSDGRVACYTCHPLHDYGTSHRATGVGHDALVGGRNEPTVYNAAGHVAQFWDGRAPDVEAQALGPVLNPVEMGMSDGDAVVSTLRAMPAYVDAFSRAFPGEAMPVTFVNFGRAIAAFERGLVTPSRWDRYLQGDAAALTAAEKEGLKTFVATGCVQCHAGAYVGGNIYQKVGLVRPWPSQADAGRFQVTGAPADRMVFKVPSLRNVEETWPYFHDGSVQRLDDAIVLMARHQLGKELTPAQVASIRAWLVTLTGAPDEAYIHEPVLPPSPPDAGASAR